MSVTIAETAIYCDFASCLLSTCGVVKEEHKLYWYEFLKYRTKGWRNDIKDRKLKIIQFWYDDITDNATLHLLDKAKEIALATVKLLDRASNILSECIEQKRGT